MTRTEISQASTRRLEARERQLRETDSFRPGSLLDDMASGAYDAAEDARWTEIDEIRDELAARAHDLEDPSSGLGLHQPS